MRCAILTALAGVAAASSMAAGGISYVSGNKPGVPVTDPLSMRYVANGYNDANNQVSVRYWSERQNVTLATPLVVSVLAPVSFPTVVTSHAENSLLTIAAGTAVNSHNIYFDPLNSASVEAVFRFDSPILGLITNERNNAANDHFMLSDHLILPSVPAANIPAAYFGARGLEMSSSERVTFVDANTVRINWTASNPGDQMRIITQVPAPGTLGCAGLALFAGTRRRRR